MIKSYTGKPAYFYSILKPLFLYNTQALSHIRLSSISNFMLKLAKLRSITIAVAVLIVSLLSGCANIFTFDSGSDNIFRLEAVDYKAKTTQSVNLQVTTPQMASGLSGSQVALIYNDIHLDYYSSIKWSEKLEEMILDRLQQSLQRSQKYKTVIDNKVKVAPDYFLAVQVLDFQAEYSQNIKEVDKSSVTPPIINITMEFIWIKESSRKIAKKRTISHKVQAKSNKLEDIMQAFNTSFALVQKDLI